MSYLISRERRSPTGLCIPEQDVSLELLLQYQYVCGSNPHKFMAKPESKQTKDSELQQACCGRQEDAFTGTPILPQFCLLKLSNEKVRLCKTVSRGVKCLFLGPAQFWGRGVAAQPLMAELDPAYQSILQQLDDTNDRLDAALRQQDAALGTSWILSIAISILFMQTGFTLLEVGALRATNIRHILVKNVTAMTLVALCWIPIGYCIAYGTEGANITFQQCLYTPLSSALHGARMFESFGLAAVCTSIAIGAVAERFAFRAYVITSMMVPLCVFPTVVSWSWTEFGILHSMGFHDKAGSAVVHIAGGMFGLVACWRVGARFGRFSVVPVPNQQTFDPQIGEYRPTMRLEVLDKFPEHSPALRVTGVLCLWFAWYSFNCAMNTSFISAGEHVNSASRIVLVTTVSAAYAGVSDLAWQTLLNRRRVLRGDKKQVFAVDGLCNSILTGLVAIAAGCDVASLLSAALVGVVAMCVRRATTHLLLQRGIDDPLEVSSIHFGGGLWGVLAVGFYHPALGVFCGGGGDFIVGQVLGGLAVSVFSLIVGLLVFSLLHFLDQRYDGVRLLRRDFHKESENKAERKFRQNVKDLVTATITLFSEPDEVQEHVVSKMGFDQIAAKEWREFVTNAYADLPRVLDLNLIRKSDFSRPGSISTSRETTCMFLDHSTQAAALKLYQKRSSTSRETTCMFLDHSTQAPALKLYQRRRHSPHGNYSQAENQSPGRNSPALVMRPVPVSSSATTADHTPPVVEGNEAKHFMDIFSGDIAEELHDGMEQIEDNKRHTPPITFDQRHTPRLSFDCLSRPLSLDPLASVSPDSVQGGEFVTSHFEQEQPNPADIEFQRLSVSAVRPDDSLQSQITELNELKDMLVKLRSNNNDTKDPSNLKDTAFVELQTIVSDDDDDSEYTECTQAASNYQDAVSDVPDSEFISSRGKGIFEQSTYGSLPFVTDQNTLPPSCSMPFVTDQNTLPPSFRHYHNTAFEQGHDHDDTSHEDPVSELSLSSQAVQQQGTEMADGMTNVPLLCPGNSSTKMQTA
eukprot:g47712.t1